MSPPKVIVKDIFSFSLRIQKLQLQRQVEGKHPVVKEAPAPRKSAHTLITSVIMGNERGSVPFFSSSFSLSSLSYHTVGSFLSLWGISSLPYCRLCLFLLQDRMMMRRKTTTVIPPPMAKANKRSSEKEAVDERKLSQCSMGY